MNSISNTISNSLLLMVICLLGGYYIISLYNNRPTHRPDWVVYDKKHIPQHSYEVRRFVKSFFITSTVNEPDRFIMYIYPVDRQEVFYKRVIVVTEDRFDSIHVGDFIPDSILRIIKREPHP